MLTPRIVLDHQAYIGPETFPLMLLGNDLFNPEMVETLGHHESRSVLTLRYGNIVECLPYQQLSTEERKKREKLFRQPSAADGSPDSTKRNTFMQSVEKAVELLMGSQEATHRVGYVETVAEEATAKLP